MNRKSTSINGETGMEEVKISNNNSLDSYGEEK